MKDFLSTSEISSFTTDVQALSKMINRYEHWFDSLPKEKRTSLENLYKAFSTELSDAKSNLTALFSEVIVAGAADSARNNKEGKL